MRFWMPMVIGGLSLALAAGGNADPATQPAKNPEPARTPALPLDVAVTVNDAWGYVHHDQQVTGSKDLIHALVKAAARNTNIMFDVGPMPGGQLPPEFKQHLGELSQWLSQHGESVFGTAGGPVRPQPWGVTTHKDQLIYVHVLDAKPGQDITLWGTSGLVVDKIRVLQDGAKVPYALDTFKNIVLRLPDRLDPVNTIVVIERKVKV